VPHALRLTAVAIALLGAAAGCGGDNSGPAPERATATPSAADVAPEAPKEHLEQTQEALIAPPVVRTGDARSKAGRVRLHGSYAAAHRTRMSFRYGPAGGGLTQQTPAVSRKGSGRFGRLLAPLRSGRRYAYRAVAANDDYQRAGALRTFVAP